MSVNHLGDRPFIPRCDRLRMRPLSAAQVGNLDGPLRARGAAGLPRLPRALPPAPPALARRAAADAEPCNCYAAALEIAGCTVPWESLCQGRGVVASRRAAAAAVTLSLLYLETVFKI